MLCVSSVSCSAERNGTFYEHQGGLEDIAKKIRNQQTQTEGYMKDKWRNEDGRN